MFLQADDVGQRPIGLNFLEAGAETGPSRTIAPKIFPVPMKLDESKWDRIPLSRTFLVGPGAVGGQSG